MHQILACFTTFSVALFIASEAYSYSEDIICSREPCGCIYLYSHQVVCPSTRELSLDIDQKSARCFIRDAQHKVWCTRLSYGNEWLRKRGGFWQMPLKNDSFVSAVGIEVDEAGNAFVGMIDSQRLRYLIFNLDNEILADLDYGKVDKKYERHELTSVRLGDEFCLAEIRHSEADGQGNRHVVNECVGVSKYVNCGAF